MLLMLRLKQEIAKAPTMHFVTKTDPIYLHTDASYYGIGGYLLKLIDAKVVPVAFVSKFFSTVQPRWSVF
jgi:RNase H-like domain found in reverse transcriptase